MIARKLTTIIFFLSVVLYCVNLRFNFSEDMKLLLFWTSILIMLGIILYQIFYVKNNTFVLFEIILLFFLLHILYQVNYFGLAESDSYQDFNFLKTIINTNSFTINPDSDVSGWPLLHLLTSSISFTIKVDPLLIAKFLPSFIESIIAISIYLFVRTIYQNEKAALLSCLIVGTIPKFISFESFFVRESYAIFFLILFFLVLYTAKKRDDPRYLALTVLLIPVMVLSHHFTSMMLMVLLFIFIFFSEVIPYLHRRETTYQVFRINIIPIFIILLLTIIFYWMIFTPGIINDFYKIYLESIGIREFASYGQRIGIDTTIVTLRGNILFYGFFFFEGILAFLLFIALFLKRSKQKIENTTFTFFLYLCLGLGAVSLLILGSLIYPDRFLPFGWLFGAIPLSILILGFKRNALRKIMVFVVITFIIFNIYNVDPEIITGSGPFVGRASEKEYAIAATINIPKILPIAKTSDKQKYQQYLGYDGVKNAIFDIQGVNLKGLMKSPLTPSNIFNYQILLILYKNLYLTYLGAEQIKNLTSYSRIVTLLSYEDYSNVNKISDLDDVVVLSWRPFIISASAGIEGRIEPSLDVGVLAETNQSFKIWANPGYQILDVIVDDVSQGPVTNYTFYNVVTNHTINVKTQYKIISKAYVGGMISPSGVISLFPGMDQTFVITANPGYRLKDVLIDDKSVGPIAIYTFSGIESDHKIDAFFIST